MCSNICLLSKGEAYVSWPWSYGSWIYNYLCNRCLSPLMLWVWLLLRAWSTTWYDKVCQWLATGQWFSTGTPVSSTNKTDRHDITEILLKVALNTIKPNHLSKRFSLGGPISCKWAVSVILTQALQVYRYTFYLLDKNKNLLCPKDIIPRHYAFMKYNYSENTHENVKVP